MNNFRPISLCNVIYKVITKIIANRFKNHMDFMIAPQQCSFVSGRKIFDNVVIRSMKTKKVGKGIMVLEVDLEKAYDLVRTFLGIQDTLLEIGLTNSFTNLIMECVTSCHMKIILNAEMTNGFNISRGSRQGNLSPYLCVFREVGAYY